jgi:phosphoglycerol transferase MdoB-like AlkP superfamily enzyme
MENITIRFRRLFWQLLLLLFLYSLCRLIFIYANHAELHVNSFKSLSGLCIGGLRFDLSAIFLTNSIFIILVLLPLPLTANKYYQKFTFLLFFLVNSLCLMTNLIDVAYFRFIQKRAQADSLLYITGEKGEDLYRQIPTFLVQYWYLFLLFGGMLWSIQIMYSYSMKINGPISHSPQQYILSTLVLFFTLGISIISIRGGIQTKPLNVIHASEMTDVKNIPAIINTPFSVFKSFGKKMLSGQKYFPDEKLQYLNQGIHFPSGDSVFRRQNVVVIILESLSNKYISYFGGKAQTPFIDSLIRQSFVFTNGFGNAKESIQGIPAILSSIPSWQQSPFIFSPYSSNRITSLANTLQTQGYHTSFFHGGFNGTMGFDSYASLAGFDQYFGKNEYNNDNDNDGHWGIWDEPFLQFMAHHLAQTEEPFFSSVLTLNTHNPYVIPKQYKTRFNKHKLPILNCVEYLDLSLQRFFQIIQDEPWFENTLFVITADHKTPNLENKEKTSVDDEKIPILFYQPNNKNLRGTSHIMANQIDILPSVLHYLHYPLPYYSPGKSLFEKGGKRFSISFDGNIYQYLDSTFCYHFNGEKTIAFYDWQKDNTLSDNLYKGNMTSDMLARDTMVKIYIQLFNQSMINNQMHAEKIK